MSEYPRIVCHKLYNSSRFNLSEDLFKSQADIKLPKCFSKMVHWSLTEIEENTKKIIKTVPVVPLFSTQHYKREILALSQELR